MSESNIATAQQEYYRRPADERFSSLADLIANAQAEKAQSQEAVYNLRDLRAVAIAPSTDGTIRPQDTAHRATHETGGTVLLQSPTGMEASFTHYSFGQLARTVGAPASYLRTLPPSIAADAINYGLHDAAPFGQTANLLVRDDPSKPTPTIRACTSETYGRVWDASLYASLNRLFPDGGQSTNGQWMTPPAWPGSLPSGNYRGDRDSFVIRVDGGSIVTDPSAGAQANGLSPDGNRDGREMYRGLLIRNSEVGHCSITIECVLFRYICGNHMLWGAIMDRQFRRRHVGAKITRDTMRELSDLAWKFNARSASQDQAIVRSLIDHEVAQTKEAVIDELRRMGATKEQASEAYATCEEKESASPRSFWGIAQGLTRSSQASGWQDDRLQLDQLAAQVLKKGALQYATV